jgi:hypothetical protein
VIEKPLQVYKEAVEMSVLDWTSNYWYTLYSMSSGEGREVGALLITVDFPLDVFFTFSPESKSPNITKFGITITAGYVGYGDASARFNLTINDKISYLTNYHLYYYYPRGLTVMSTLTQEPSILQAISIGINNLKMRPSVDMWIFRVNVFIEYEYLA